MIANRTRSGADCNRGKKWNLNGHQASFSGEVKMPKAGAPKSDR
jgi:hypothetical protein